jgi:hypothetical protein
MARKLDTAISVTQTKGSTPMMDWVRVRYVVFDLAPRIDTVALLAPEEVNELIARARTGEFDDDMEMALQARNSPLEVFRPRL